MIHVSSLRLAQILFYFRKIGKNRKTNTKTRRNPKIYRRKNEIISEG